MDGRLLSKNMRNKGMFRKPCTDIQDWRAGWLEWAYRLGARRNVGVQSVLTCKMQLNKLDLQYGCCSYTR